MKLPAPAACALLLMCACAQAASPSDPKTLANFDAGYARCEILYAHMRGHGDAAYLALWRLAADAPRRAELAALRQQATYRAARQAALKRVPAKVEPGSPADTQLKGQCQATWAELSRVAQQAPPASAAR